MDRFLTIAVVLALALIPTTARAESPSTAPAATQPAAVTGGPAAGPASTPAADGFSPMILLAVVAILFLFCVAVVLAAILSAAALFLGAALLLFGIISSSVLVGLIRRTGGSAARAFIVQASAVIGAPVGVVALWLQNRLFHIGLSHGVIVFVGIVGGLATGAAAGALFSLAAARLARLLLLWIQPHPPSAPLGGFPAIAPATVLKAEAD